MMRQPAALPRAQRGSAMNKAQTSYGAALPAPVGGWNAKDSLAAMPPKDAVRLENWIPRATFVELRAGAAIFMQSPPANIETLLAYTSDPAGTDKLFAASDGDIYDANTEGASFTSPVYTGLVSNRIQYINFSNDADGFMLCVTGSDTPFRYDGSTWATLTITGSSGSIILDSADLIEIMAYQERVFLAEKNALRVWFLDVSAVQGTAQLLDLGPVFTQGGKIVGMGTWSAGRVEGPDEYAIFLTDQGEVAIFSGTDPAVSTEWVLFGVFDIGEPLGGNGRALVKTGGELNVLTKTGIVPLGQALSRNRADDDKVALTAKIRSAFITAASSYGTLFGWGGMIYDPAGLAIYNVPTEQGVSAEQYVQELESGAWCKFTGWNAFSWAATSAGLWFGGPGGIYKALTGVTDAGADMTAVAVPAFSAFGRPGMNKLFTAVRPIFYVSQEIKPAVEMLTDFADRTPTAVPTTVVDRTQTTELRQEWATVGGIGYYGSPAVAVTVNGDPDAATILGDGAGNTIIVGNGDTSEIAVDSGAPLSAVVQLLGYNVQYRPGGVY